MHNFEPDVIVQRKLQFELIPLSLFLTNIEDYESS